MKIEIPGRPYKVDVAECSWADVAVDPARVGRDPDRNELSGGLYLKATEDGITIDFFVKDGPGVLRKRLSINEIMDLLE